MNSQTTVSQPANGATSAHELFALTDEQILGIEPADASEAASVEQPLLAVPAVDNRQETSARGNEQPGHMDPASVSEKPAQARVPVLLTEPPAWLARQMKDPWIGDEARELWDGVLRAQAETAEYRASIASPADAKTLKE